MARTFNGTSDYATIASAPVTAVPLTMSAWFNPNDASSYSCICIVTGAGNGWQAWGMLASAGNILAWTTNPSEGSDVFSQKGTYSAGQWSHAAAVFATNASRIAYLNGVAGTEETTSRTPSGINQTSISRLGSNWGDIYFFPGELAHVAMWSAALTAAEIAALSAGFSPDLIRPQSLVRHDLWVRGNVPNRGAALTLTGTSDASDHPRIILPRRKQVVVASAAAPSTTVARLVNKGLVGSGLVGRGRLVG